MPYRLFVPANHDAKKKYRLVLWLHGAAGGKPRCTEYPGVGHNVWERAFTEPELLPWVFSQHR